MTFQEMAYEMAPQQIPAGISAAFIALTLALLVALAFLLRNALPTARARNLTIAGLAAWLALTGAVAASGWLYNFTALPPRMFLFLLPTWVLLIYMAASSRVRPYLLRMPPRGVLLLQTFRIPVELVLAALVGAGLLSPIMSYHGRNFDIVTGLTAPIAALCCAGGRITRPGLLLVWNVMGLALVTNVVTHGILSIPTPLRLLYTEPPNTVMALFPMVWLPTFGVPMAYFLHIVSIRQALAARRERPSSA